MAATLTVAELAGYVADRAAATDRFVLGVTGPPGSGKSTIAAAVADSVGAVVVPMDGFHLANDVLDDRGLRGEKGSPRTFAADRFVELVDALGDHRRTVRAPAFDRATDEPVADAVVVPRGARMVIVEGNYLLLDDPPWDRLAGRFDAVAYVQLDDDVRRARLIARHVHYGRSAADAADFVERSDEANTRLIEPGRVRADIVVRGPVS